MALHLSSANSSGVHIHRTWSWLVLVIALCFSSGFVSAQADDGEVKGENSFCKATVKPPDDLKSKVKLKIIVDPDDTDKKNLIVQIALLKQKSDQLKMSDIKKAEFDVTLTSKGNWKLKEGSGAAASPLTLKKMKLGDEKTVSTDGKTEGETTFKVSIQLERPHIETVMGGVNQAATNTLAVSGALDISGSIYQGTLTLYDVKGDSVFSGDYNTGGMRAGPPLPPGADTYAPSGYFGVITNKRDESGDPINGPAMGHWAYIPKISDPSGSGRTFIYIHEDFDENNKPEMITQPQLPPPAPPVPPKPKWKGGPGTHGCVGLTGSHPSSQFHDGKMKTYMQDEKTKPDWTNINGQ